MAQLSTKNRDILDKSSLPEFQAAGLGTTIYEASQYAPVVFTYKITADATGNPTAFTAPFAMEIDDIHVIATATSGGGTVTPKKGTDAICTAIACATDGVVARMAAGVDGTKLVLAAGDTVGVDTNGANDRGIVVFLGHRV